MIRRYLPENMHNTEGILMALITCPECGKQVSDRAAACPNCGCPISASPASPEKKIPVHFWRKKNILNGVANTGRVLVDGVMAGSAENGASFELMLSPGNHIVLIESRTNGAFASSRSNSATITVPEDASRVEVEMKLKSDAMSFLGSGGMAIVVGEVAVYH